MCHILLAQLRRILYTTTMCTHTFGVNGIMQNFRPILLGIIVGLSVSQSASAECKPGTKVPFIDDAVKNKEFAAFRQKITGIAKAKDRSALKTVLAEPIKFSFGPEKQTKEAFIKGLLEDNGWGELAKALTNGGNFKSSDQKSFWFPFYFDGFPSDCDAFDTQVALGKSVELFKEANAKSEVLARLSYEIVGRGEGGSTGTFESVIAKGGLKGFVKTEFLGSPVGYRGHFVKSPNGWKLDTFIAGD